MARILVGSETQTSKLSGILSDDLYHTEFVSWPVDHFSFLSIGGLGPELTGNSIIIFFISFNRSLNINK